jgi:hypothetical protein
MKVQIKLYDKKDFDYYNPRPYIKSLLKHLKREDYNNVSYYFDESEHDYLFVWPADKQSSSNKKDRVIVENFAEVIKEKHMRKFISRFENYLDNKASGILEEIESLKKQIEKQEHLLSKYNEEIQEKKNQLKEFEGIVKQYAVQN